jgi:hypothetical protein
MIPMMRRAPEDIPGNQDGLINDQTPANRPDSEAPQEKGKAKGKAMPDTDNSGMGYGSSGPASPVEDQARE